MASSAAGRPGLAVFGSGGPGRDPVAGLFPFTDLARDGQLLLRFSRAIVQGTAQHETGALARAQGRDRELFEQLLRLQHLRGALGDLRGLVFELTTRAGEAEATGDRCMRR